MRIIQDLTPKNMCQPGKDCCPALFKTDNGSYVLVGKIVDAGKLNILNRVGEDEVAIEVPGDLIDLALNK